MTNIEKLQGYKEDLYTGDYGEFFADYYDLEGYICDTVSSIADDNTSIYYSDILKFITEYPDSLKEVIDEGLYDPSCNYDLHKHGQSAQFMMIERDLYDNIEANLQLVAYTYIEKMCEIDEVNALEEEKFLELIDLIDDACGNNPDQLEDIAIVIDEFFNNDDEDEEDED